MCYFLIAGIDGIIYNGIPDWLYLNTPELTSDTLAFSTNGSYLSFLSFNDSQVADYEYVDLLTVEQIYRNCTAQT